MPGGSEATEGVRGLAPTPRPVRLGALRHRDFRLFWIGQLVSQIGTWMQSVAQAWLVLELTKSPLQLGFVSALQFVPMYVQYNFTDVNGGGHIVKFQTQSSAIGLSPSAADTSS